MGIVDKVLAQDMGALRLNLVSLNGGWENLIQVIVNWVLILAAVIAFIYLIWSGFIYLTAGGNADNAKKGQQGIINAIIGIVIIVLSYAIMAAVVNFTGGGANGCPSGSHCDMGRCIDDNSFNDTGRTCTN